MPSPLVLHEEQQFQFLLFTAVERYTERLEQRCGGSSAALRRLRHEPDGEGIWLTQFAEAIFNDFLLNNAAGACFVLRALSSQPAPPAAGSTIDAHLQSLARAAFAAVLQSKTEESLERNAMFEQAPIATGA